jgi:hypothetical protein
MSGPQIRGRIAVTLTVCGVLFLFAGDGIRGYFTPDDMMNLYRAWSAGPADLVRQDRPVGQIVYHGLFALAGLNPLPYRLLAFALLLVNLGLLWRFCLRLSGSREIGALACLLGAYHAHLADLYYSSGTYYDLLCWLFTLGAFDYYAGIRQRGRYPDLRQTAALVALFVLALGSKEMAAALPLYIPVYEALYGKDFRAWLRRGAWFWWLSLPITAAYAFYKLAGPQAMTANPDYAPQFTVHAFFTAWRHYLADLFYGALAFNDVKVVLLFAAMLALAIYTRRREMLFAWVVAFAGALPLIFIPPRGMFVLYLTLPGWCLYAASVVALLRDALLRRIPRWAAAFDARPEQLALFAALVLALVPLHWHEKPAGKWWVQPDYDAVRTVMQSLDRDGPLRRDARVLFLSDPFDRGDWILSNMFRLHYRDDALQVDRAKDHPELAARAADYDRVYAMDSRGLHRIRANTDAVPR